MITLQTPWTRQPQVAPRIARTPLTQGLLGLIWGGAGSAQGRDLVTGYRYLNVNNKQITPSGVSYGQTTQGGAGGVTSERYPNDPNKNWYPATCPISLVVAFHSFVRPSSSNAAILGGCNTNLTYVIQERNDSGYYQFGLRVGGASYSQYGSSSNPIRIGELNVIVLTADGTTMRGFLNGMEIGTGTAIASSTLNYDTTYNRINLITATNPDGGTGAAAAGHYLALYERILSRGEIVQLYENPWQLFAPIRRRIWTPSAGAAAFNPSWAAGSNQIIGVANVS